MNMKKFLLIIPFLFAKAPNIEQSLVSLVNNEESTSDNVLKSNGNTLEICEYDPSKKKAISAVQVQTKKGIYFLSDFFTETLGEKFAALEPNLDFTLVPISDKQQYIECLKKIVLRYFEFKPSSYTFTSILAGKRPSCKGIVCNFEDIRRYLSQIRGIIRDELVRAGFADENNNFLFNGSLEKFISVIPESTKEEINQLLLKVFEEQEQKAEKFAAEYTKSDKDIDKTIDQKVLFLFPSFMEIFCEQNAEYKPVLERFVEGFVPVFGLKKFVESSNCEMKLKI